MKPFQLLLVAAVAILANACTVFVKDEMVVSPSVEIDQENLTSLLDVSGYTAVEVANGGETLYGLEKNYPGADTTILVLHGYALNLSMQPWFGLLELLSGIEANVLAINYPGFGSSSGDASFSTELAKNERVKGLIIEGGITNTEEMVTLFKSRKFLGSLFTVEVEDTLQFDNLNALAELEKPVLIIHGRNDENIPFDFGERLFATANGSASFYPVEDGGPAIRSRSMEQHF